MGKRKVYCQHKKNKRSKIVMNVWKKKKQGLESCDVTIQSCSSSKDVIKTNPQISPHNSPNNLEIPSFISEREYEDVMSHQLHYEPEKEPTSVTGNIITGNRIVDIGYVLNWAINLQYDHSKICTGGKLHVKEEIRWGTGLVSCIVFKCTMCPKEYKKYTEDPEKISKINTGAVWGTLATGSTYGHLEEQLCILDIPTMTLYKFKQIESELANLWKDQIYINMEKAGLEERQQAIEMGNTDDDGVPYITVYLDGGWSKRSYGHSYNAASGTAIIIGKVTGKVLFLGVRNKYCSVCARAANLQVPPNSHVCYRNWSGSSGAMESDIIVEGFCKSEEMHNLRYKYFVADGDSSVFAKIRQKVHYGDCVQKIECTNHAIKNYGKGLRKIKNDTSINLKARKILTTKIIEQLEKVAQNGIYNNAKAEVERLKEDLANGPHHVFQDHRKCQNYYCEQVGKINENEFEKVQRSSLLLHVKGALDGLLKKAHRLVDNETNNRAETFMAILARFNAGKRLNLTQRGSFETRSHLAGLRYNEGINWHASSWKIHLSESPGVYFKKYLQTQQRKKEHNSTLKHGNVHEKAKRQVLPDIDYGPNATRAELSETEMASESKRILKSLQVTSEEQVYIAEQTVGQFNNNLYLLQRKHRLTASFFGSVVNRLTHTPCHHLVKSILYQSNFCSAAMEYGKNYEHMVREKYALEYHQEVNECGLYVDLTYGYLAASPDGIIGQDALLEIKCLHSVAKNNLNFEEAVKNGKITSLKMDPAGQIMLKRNHNYYYQIQGQLNITGRNICHFVVYTGDKNPLFVEIITKDENLWQEKMLPKLKQFYTECVLPEIIKGNIQQGKPCEDPPYIREAQEKKILQNKSPYIWPTPHSGR